MYIHEDDNVRRYIHMYTATCTQLHVCMYTTTHEGRDEAMASGAQILENVWPHVHSQ